MSQRQPLILILGGVGQGQEDKLLVSLQCPGSSQQECDYARAWSVRATQAPPWADFSLLRNQAGLTPPPSSPGPIQHLATWERLRAGPSGLEEFPPGL